VNELRDALAATIRQHEGHGLRVSDGAIRCLVDGSVLLSVAALRSTDVPSERELDHIAWAQHVRSGPDPMSTETLTENLRRRLRERIECPTCYQPMPGDTQAKLAAEVGLAPSILSRFLNGKDMTGRNLDKVAAYLADLP
jgi:hypothetical protein